MKIELIVEVDPEIWKKRPKDLNIGKVIDWMLSQGAIVLTTWSERPENRR